MNNSSDSPLKFKKNLGISEISDFYNNIGVDKTQQNQLTATIFYTVAPFHPKTIARKKNNIINPDNSIDSILKSHGGYFFRFINNEDIDIDDYPFLIFSWISLFLDLIVNSPIFEQITTIELDATFDALSPYRICVPQLIYRNSGILIGLLVSISESSFLYSLFFESLKKIRYESSKCKIFIF